MGRGLMVACIVAGSVWSASCGGSSQKNADGGGGRGGGGGTAGGSGGDGTGGLTGGAGGSGGDGSNDGSALSVALLLKAWQTGPTQALFPGIAFAFSGSAQLMSDITFRYWYTADFASAGPTSQSYECDSTNGLVCEYMNVTIVPVTPPRPMADHYAEVSFPGYPGYYGGSFQYSVMFRIRKADQSTYDQANDYSYNGSGTDWLPTTKITAYLRGARFQGQEP